MSKPNKPVSLAVCWFKDDSYSFWFVDVGVGIGTFLEMVKMNKHTYLLQSPFPASTCAANSHSEMYSVPGQYITTLR